MEQIDSVKINPSLVMMREWPILAKMANKWVFTPFLSAWGPFTPTKSVPEAAIPLSVKEE